MKPVSSHDIRQAFLNYFAQHGHAIVPSSPLVPGNDPTLLFTNAGMVQFKDVFLGLDQRDYRRATTAQKCMRVSGKHNDLENVGPSPRHHTFFEMLGNFSFGDYFKREACRLAYDLLVNVYGLPPERLAYTVHHDDQESFDIWVNEVGIPAERVHRMGDKDNFWMMADVGPCGYTSEIHYDKRPEEGLESLPQAFDQDTGRFLELWNLVFMQFEQFPDGTRQPLPAPGVDTGMGLERMVSVLQGKEVNYETDLFMPIIRATQALTGQSDSERDANIIPYRVIADHMRAACFLIADGVRPGPNGRDYVCRMVMRRAMRFGRKLGFDEPFLADVADAVIDNMSAAYPELEKGRDSIRRVVTNEERRFSRAMDRGLHQLDAMLDELPAGGTLDGSTAFFLHSSLGLPFEITRDVAAERGFGVDYAGFERAKADHAQKAGEGAFEAIDRGELYVKLLEDLRASGALEGGVAQDQYGELKREAHILALLRVSDEGVQIVESAEAGQRVEVIVNLTPFYVESGGQVSDTGVIRAHDGSFSIDIEDARKPIGGLIIHVGEVVEGIALPQAVSIEVDADRRLDITRNHTATHLLHEALRRRLGTHVQQRGSLVTPDRLRFDFSHDAALTTDELHDVERDINAQILRNLQVSAVWKSLEAAKAEGAMALFGEKYGAEVRTISISDATGRYSYELCGGNHVPETALIGSFHITAEGAVAQGVRRIEAVTGREAQQFTTLRLNLLNVIAKNLGVAPENAPERVAQLQAQIRALQQEREVMLLNTARIQFDNLKEKNINGVRVLVARVQNVNNDTLRQMTDWFRDRHPERGVAVLGTVTEEGRPALVAAVTKDLTGRVHAGNLIKDIAPLVGGGGGGKPTMAQAGGKDPAKLDEALDRAYKLVAGLLEG
jgi:alanyl-tRNA synthetase